jgi:hypothetical protein
MLKRIVIVTTLVAFAALTAVASDREDDVKRTDRAAQVFKEIMNTPDQGIPQGTGNLSHRAWLERSHVCSG